ncbi:MAG: alpha/beta hydrolase [Armatimonadota bacterium]
MKQETLSTVKTRDGISLSVRRYESQDRDSSADTLDLLLLHGWPNTGSVWRPLVDVLLLGDASLRIFAPDLRGYGSSDKPENGYRCATFADDVEDIAAALGLRNYVLVGHSMSGKIAQLVASRQPDGLAALVLVTPGLLAASPPVDVSKRKEMHGNPRLIRDMIASWAGHPLPTTEAELLAEEAVTVGRSAWNGWLSPMRDEDFSREIGKIAVPTLVIGGGKDPQRTEDELRRGVVARITGAEYVRLPNSGHLPHIEEPTALAALMVNFLSNISAGETTTP